jgi:hypothetical protein
VSVMGRGKCKASAMYTYYHLATSNERIPSNWRSSASDRF